MAKQYFRHDFYTRTSPNVLDIRRKYGLLGYGAYWSLVEIMFEQDGFILDNTIPAIAYDLHCESDMLLDILSNYNLFDFEDQKYTALWIIESLKNKNELIKKLKENGSKGGKAKAKNKQSVSNDLANANDNDSKNLANASDLLSTDLPNQLNKTRLDNNKIKLNKVVNSNELTTNGRSDGSIYYLEILNEKLDDLEKQDYGFGGYIERLKALFEKMSYEPNIKNGNATLQTEKVLYDMINIFARDAEAVKDLIIECFDVVDSKPFDIKNKYKYAISVFRNRALGI